MICRFCGKEIEEGSQICNHCAKPVIGLFSSETNTNTNAVSMGEEIDEEKLKNNKRVATILSVIAIFLFFGSPAIYRFLKNIFPYEEEICTNIALLCPVIGIILVIIAIGKNPSKNKVKVTANNVNTKENLKTENYHSSLPQIGLSLFAGFGILFGILAIIMMIYIIIIIVLLFRGTMMIP